MADTKLELLVAQYDRSMDASPDLRLEMERAVNELIQYDFDRLVSILYRIDVSEKKIRQLAGQPNEDAARLLTGLILARLEEKRRSRARFRQSGEIPEDEAW